MTKPDYDKRRQRVFLLLSGLFLGTLAMLNILGISRFVDLSFSVFGVEIPMVVAIGVLPYPITFMCTDLISELYGEKKARDMVWVGVLLNAWVIFILWLGGVLPGFEPVDVSTGAPALDEAGRLRGRLRWTKRAGYRCFLKFGNWRLARWRPQCWPTLWLSFVMCGYFISGRNSLGENICGCAITPPPWSARLSIQRR